VNKNNENSINYGGYGLVGTSLVYYLLKKNLLIYNLSSNYSFITIQIIRLIYKLLKKKPNYLIKNISKQESQSKRLSFDKIRKEVKWSPKTEIQE
jgi:dTDP-D-glucose 4,6-dehydratase